jgi:M6 family metalloprotease-like protein
MRSYAGVIYCLLILAAIAQAVPLRPDIRAPLRNKGSLPAIQALVEDARDRGLDVPTTRPFLIRNQNSADEPDTLRAIVILVDFFDNPADTIAYPPSHFHDLLFSQNACHTGSLTDYYLEVSYNGILFQGDVTRYYRLPQSNAYYTNNQYGFGAYPQNAQRLAEDAVFAADSDVDFSQYDNDGDGYVDACYVVHAGPGAEITGDPNDIWSHKWSTSVYPHVDGVMIDDYCTGPEDGNIGIFCHETGHLVFGLPDLYDLDAPPFDSKGLGDWSLMAYGCWLNGGRTPAHLDAYCKIQAGFLTPEIPTIDLTSVSFPMAEANQVVYRLWTEGAMGVQYFLVENRQKVGFDEFLPGEGLLIYHVDQSGSTNNRPWYPGYTTFGHYMVALEQADGNWDLERNVNSGDDGDPWPGVTNHTEFNDTSFPSSQTYSFENTHIGVANISNSESTMSADIYVAAGISGTLWTRTFGGTAGDYAYSVQQTADRGFIICGSTGSLGAGYSDVWLIKTDARGNEEWNRTFGGSSSDVGESAQQTRDGGYIIAGNTYSFGAGMEDVWLIKTDATGNEQWNRTFGATSDDWAYSVQQTSDGGYIMTGFTWIYQNIWLIKTDSMGIEQWSRAYWASGYGPGNSVRQTSDNGFIIAGSIWLVPGGNYDAWLIKTDSAGNEEWNHHYGGIDDDGSQSVQQTADGGYILAGTTEFYSVGDQIWLIKIDADGNRIWDRTFGGSGADCGSFVAQTDDAGYVVVGCKNYFGAGHGEVYVIRCDWRGNQQWNKIFGGVGADWGYCVQQTIDGGYIIAGTTESYGAGGSDVWLIRLSSETPAALGAQCMFPSDFTLFPVYPNPFNATTTLTFSLSWASKVSLIIYTIEGRQVAALASGQYQPGLHRIGFDASNLSSGMYFVQLLAPGFSQTQKMVVLK